MRKLEELPAEAGLEGADAGKGMSRHSLRRNPPEVVDAISPLHGIADGSPLEENESPTMTQCSESIAPRWNEVSLAGLQNKVVIPDKGATNLDFNISTAAKK